MVVMLSRVAIVSARQREAYSRALSYSGKSLRGISIGGNPDDLGFDFDAPEQSRGSQFAFLKKEIEKSRPKEEKDLEQKTTTSDTIEAPQVSRSKLSSARLSLSANNRNDQSSLVAKPERPVLPEETSRRRNSFDRRPTPPKEEESHGWGPVLREKFAKAPEVEQQKSVADISEETMSAFDYDISVESFKVRFPDFSMVQARPCNDIFGFEKWYIVSKREKNNNLWSHLFVRRYTVPQDEASALFSTLAAAITTTKAVPRHMFLENSPQFEKAKMSLLHIEMGGWSETKVSTKYSCPRFPYHRGLSSADGFAILHIESILKMHEEVGPEVPQMSHQQDVKGRERRQEPAFETIHQQDVNGRERRQEPAFETIPLIKQPNEKPFERNQRSIKNTSSSIPGARNPIDVSRGTSSHEQRKMSNREPPQSQQRNSSRKEEFRERASNRQGISSSKMKDRGWATMYGREYGNGQGKVRSSLVDLVTKLAPVESKTSTMMQDINRKGTSNESQSLNTEQATPAFIDEKQANGTAMTSGSEQTIQPVNQRQKKTSVKKKVLESSPIKEAASTSQEERIASGKPYTPDNTIDQPVEESTPVHIDGEQAKETATNQAEDVIKQQQEEMPVNESHNTPISNDASSRPIEEVTPVYIDGQQASETTTSMSQVEEHVNAEMNTPDTTESSPVEEATPVYVDGEQASTTVAGSTGDASENDAEQSNLKAATSGIEESTPFVIDDEQIQETAAMPTADNEKVESQDPSSSEASARHNPEHSISPSDNKVDESTPVAIEGDQVGKQYTL